MSFEGEYVSMSVPIPKSNLDYMQVVSWLMNVGQLNFMQSNAIYNYHLQTNKALSECVILLLDNNKINDKED